MVYIVLFGICNACNAIYTTRRLGRGFMTKTQMGDQRRQIWLMINVTEDMNIKSLIVTKGEMEIYGHSLKHSQRGACLALCARSGFRRRAIPGCEESRSCCSSKAQPC